MDQVIDPVLGLEFGEWRDGAYKKEYFSYCFMNMMTISGYTYQKKGG